MDKKAAIEKINKLLALASNSAATEGEKNNALEMANKIASKYGLKIIKCEEQKTVQKPSEYKAKFFTVSYFDQYIVVPVLKILNVKFKCNPATKEILSFNMSDKDIEKFKVLYKALYKEYANNLNRNKQFKSEWTRNDTKSYRKLFLIAFAELIELPNLNNYSGNDNLVFLANEFKKLRKEEC